MSSTPEIPVKTIPILTNWQTTAAGLIVIALGAAKTFLGIEVPGFSLDFIAALPVGVGLILASDAASLGGVGPPPSPPH
jgi:hypothetical protein